MTTDTDRQPTEAEIATARAWVDRLHGVSMRSVLSDDPGAQADADAEARDARDAYAHALAVLMFAADWKPPVVVTDLRCGCHAHLSHWGDSGSTTLRRQCGEGATAYHKDLPTLPVCDHCADCDAGLSKGFLR